MLACAVLAVLFIFVCSLPAYANELSEREQKQTNLSEEQKLAINKAAYADILEEYNGLYDMDMKFTSEAELAEFKKSGGNIELISEEEFEKGLLELVALKEESDKIKQKFEEEEGISFDSIDWLPMGNIDTTKDVQSKASGRRTVYKGVSGAAIGLDAGANNNSGYWRVTPVYGCYCVVAPNYPKYIAKGWYWQPLDSGRTAAVYLTGSYTNTSYVTTYNVTRYIEYGATQFA